MQEAKHVIVFTGAGINTFSGILFYSIILLDTAQKSGVGSQNSNKKAQDILQRCIGKCPLEVPFQPTVREFGQVQWSLKMAKNGSNMGSTKHLWASILLDTAQKSGVGSQNSNKEAQDILQGCIGKCPLEVPFQPTVEHGNQEIMVSIISVIENRGISDINARSETCDSLHWCRN